jgi:OOP family OmpA-OmpF porin
LLRESNARERALKKLPLRSLTRFLKVTYKEFVATCCNVDELSSGTLHQAFKESASMNLRPLQLTAAVAALGIASSAAAQSPMVAPNFMTGFYLGAGLGYGNADFKSSTFDVSQNLVGGSQQNSDDGNYWTPWKIFGGYRFTPFLAAEAAYLSAGNYSYDSTVFQNGVQVGTVNSDYKVSSFNLAGIARYPFQNTGFAIQGKLGAAIAEAKNDINVSSPLLGTNRSESSTRTNLLWGGGVSYDFSNRIGTILEYENIGEVGSNNTGKATIYTVTGSVYYRF